MEQILVVAETNPLRLAEPGVLSEADAQGVKNRVDQEGEEADNPGADEEEANAEVLPLFPGQAEATQWPCADRWHRGSQQSSPSSQQRAADQSARETRIGGREYSPAAINATQI